jgi:chaperonin GroES
MKAEQKETSMDTVEPIGLRVLVRKDDDRTMSKGGIVLPGTVEIPVLTGRIVAISVQVENDPDYPISRYDKVLLNPSGCVPVDLEDGNRLFIIPVDDIVAVIRKGS